MKCSSTEEYEKTIDFYKNILGIPVAREWQAGIMLDTGNGIVEIFNDGDDAPDNLARKSRCLMKSDRTY